MYSAGSAFVEPLYYVDMYQCPWPKNATNDETNCSDSRSIYLDQNLLSSEYRGYSVCFDQWIGDGYCHDQCRTDECLNDGGDCGDECNEHCSIKHFAWLYLAGYGVYGANHSYVCSIFWEQAMNEFGTEADCNTSLRMVDFNKDSHLNFREFVVLADVVSSSAVRNTALGWNCSNCIGMEHYNPYFG